MNVAGHIERASHLYPDKIAIIHEVSNRRVSYNELNEQVNRVAHFLEEKGVVAGERVAILLPNNPEFIYLYLGVLKVGAIAVPINPLLKQRELAVLIHDCQPSLIFGQGDSLGRIPDIAEILMVPSAPRFSEMIPDTLSYEYLGKPMNPEDAAVIVYTSGTTGNPKGVTLSHGNLIANIRAKKRYLELSPYDKLLLFLPLFHCFGQNAIMNSNFEAASTLVMQEAFDVERVPQTVAEYGITVFFGVPLHYRVLLESLSDRTLLDSVRLFFSAAATLPLSLETQWLEALERPIFQGYGLSETSPFATYNHQEHYKPGSIGTPIEGVCIKILNTTSGSECEAGEIGEIAIRGHNVMLGYWNQPEKTAAAIRNGWFYTGDTGFIDEDGYLFIRDRVKDLINVGGNKVYPVEIENVLLEYPDVEAAAVYRVPDDLLGESITADVVVRPGSSVTSEDLIAFCRKEISGYKVPRSIRRVESLPVSPSGKVLKRVLYEQSES